MYQWKEEKILYMKKWRRYVGAANIIDNDFTILVLLFLVYALKGRVLLEDGSS